MEEEVDPDQGPDLVPGPGLAEIVEVPGTDLGPAPVDLAEAPNPAPGQSLAPDLAHPRTRPTGTVETPLREEETKGEDPDLAPEAGQGPGQRAPKITKETFFHLPSHQNSSPKKFSLYKSYAIAHNIGPEHSKSSNKMNSSTFNEEKEFKL